MLVTRRRPDPVPAIAMGEGGTFCLVQMNVLNNLLAGTVCKHCHAAGLTVQEGTQLGLATKLHVTRPDCGTVASSWTSARQNEAMAFGVNIRAIMAAKQIGKGWAALDDFWAAMNVPHCVLHHKTFQKHLKKRFRDSETECMDKFYAESAAAIKKVYKEMDPSFTRDGAVAYDGTWHKRGHTSHIGVGAVIKYHTGLI